MILIFNILPYDLEFHEYKSKVAGIIRKSNGAPVIFQSNYRLASVYAFETRNIHVYSYGCKTAFDEWNNDTYYYNKPVMIVGSDFQNEDTIVYGKGKIQTVSFVKCYPNLNNNLSMK
jgi:hypothetical protein